MAVSISLSITQNSQNIANNTSNVTVKVTAKWTGGSFNRNDPSGSCTINGTKYTFTSDFNANQTTSGSQTIFTKTLNITHGSDGTKTLSCSASFATGVSSGTVTASASKTLTTIPRKSTMSVGNGTLGTAQTLTVTRKSSSFTHTITATCGSSSTTICTKSSSTSISFTPPIAWSSQNTTGTSVSVKYTITTYSGSTNVGSNSYTKTCSIPASVKPSCSLSVSDPTGYLSTYGGYVQGLSKFTVSVSASGSYSSTIKSYKTTANGGTYTASSFTTGVITSSGTLTVSATVTDSRSRTATATKSDLKVLAYATPKISSFSVARCNQDGIANSGGSYMKVTFSSSVTSLSSKNKATYTLKYKKSTDSTYTTVTLSNYANNYAVSSGSYIFAADTASSYNITLTLTDNFNSVSSSGTGSTANKLISLLAKGTGIAFGKIAEIANAFECGMIARFAKQVYFANGTAYYINANGGANLQNVVANGVLQSTGATTLKSTLAVTGATTLSSTLKVSGNTTHAGHCYFANGTTYYINNAGAFNLLNGTVNGNLNVNSGGLYLKNNVPLRGYQSNGTTYNYLAYITQSNNVVLANTTLNTYLYGNNLYLQAATRIYIESGTTLNHQMNLGSDKASDGNNYYINNKGTARFNTLKYTSSSAYSSRRYKNRINYKDIDYWHNALIRMKPCTFYYNNDDKTEHLGLIAEELIDLIPELVGLDDEGKPASIEYANLTIPLIGEVQRQNKIIEKQQEEINSLKEENKQIKEEMQQLKELVAKLVS